MAWWSAWGQRSASAHLVNPLLSAGLVIPVACHIQSMLWSGISWNEVSPHISLGSLISVCESNMRAEVCQLFLSGTQCPHFSSGCCMTLSKCWLLSAELGVSALCVQDPAGIWDQKVKLSLMVDKCLATISNTVYSITESFLFPTYGVNQSVIWNACMVVFWSQLATK